MQLDKSTTYKIYRIKNDKPDTIHSSHLYITDVQNIVEGLDYDVKHMMAVLAKRGSALINDGVGDMLIVKDTE